MDSGPGQVPRPRLVLVVTSHYDYHEHSIPFGSSEQDIVDVGRERGALGLD